MIYGLFLKPCHFRDWARMLQPLRNSRLRSGATALGYRAFIQMGYATGWYPFPFALLACTPPLPLTSAHPSLLLGTATRIKEINSEVEWERILKDADTLKKPIIAEFSAQVRTYPFQPLVHLPGTLNSKTHLSTHQIIITSSHLIPGE